MSDTYKRFSEALIQQMRLAGRVCFGRDKDRLKQAEMAQTGVLALVEDGMDMRTVYANQLLGGSTFYWASDLCTFLEQTAPGIPDWTLTADGLLSTAGFIWFARPLAMPVYPQFDIREPLRLAALSWSPIYYEYQPGRTRSEFFQSDKIGIPSDTWIVFSHYMLLDGKAELGGSLSWQHGETLVSLLPKTPDQLIEYAWHAALARYIGAIFSFLEQEILIAPNERPDRRTIRHLPPFAPRDPLVRVVKLRRAASATSSVAKHKDVEWSCQWLVRGHWRQQWYPKTQAYKPKFIMPYVKGPEDKPLRPPRPTIFGVVR